MRGLLKTVCQCISCHRLPTRTFLSLIPYFFLKLHLVKNKSFFNMNNPQIQLETPLFFFRGWPVGNWRPSSLFLGGSPSDPAQFCPGSRLNSSMTLPMMKKQGVFFAKNQSRPASLTFSYNPATISGHYDKTMKTSFSYSINNQIKPVFDFCEGQDKHLNSSYKKRQPKNVRLPLLCRWLHRAPTLSTGWWAIQM